MEKSSDLIGADAYPAQTPQAQADKERTRLDYTTSPHPEPEEFNWAMNGGFIQVGKNDPKELFAQMNHSDFSRPYAYGKLHIEANWRAVWELTYTNMAVHLVEKRLKKFTKDQSWNHVTIVDHTGMPLEGQKIASVPGVGEHDFPDKFWRGGDEDGQYGQNVEQVDFYGTDNYPDERDPDGHQTCSECGQIFPNYNSWRLHTLHEHVNPHRTPPETPQPVIDMDQVFPADFNTLVMDKTVQRQAALLQRMSVKIPYLPGPIPFIYDIESDRIFVGHPGERHSDIQGKFTPSGILEGVYDPKGNVQIRTDTDMPYTVRHMVQLWYAMHPELVIKGIYLLVGEKKHKLAGNHGTMSLMKTSVGHKVKAMLATDEAAWDVYNQLAPYGNIYIVGGAVRDVIMGKTPKDFDMLAQSIPEQKLASLLHQLPGKVAKTGKDFGVYRYRAPNGDEVEIALPRTERSSGNAHKDFVITADASLPIESDLVRRDFTANALAVDLNSGKLVDPHNGFQDIRNNNLTLVNDKALEEDPLRILRALATVSKNGLKPDQDLLDKMQMSASRLEHLPAERIQAELDKIFAGDDPTAAMRLAASTGAMHYIFPEWTDCIGFDQKSKYHNLNLDDHILSVLSNICKQTDDKDLRLAAFLHDIGKPKSCWYDEEGYGHYYKHHISGQGQQHEIVGSDMAESIMRRLKYPNSRIDRVSYIVRHHMFDPFDSAAGARKFLNKHSELAPDLLTHRWADNGGKDKPDSHDDVSVNYQRQLLAAVAEQQAATDLSQLDINGKDLMDAGIPQGPKVGEKLKELLAHVLEVPEDNNKSTLLKIAMGQEHVSNILDPIQGSLDPDIFNRADAIAPSVKPHIIKWVKEHVYQTMKMAGWPDPKDYLSLVLTGSLTTFQWSAESDFDISLFVDAKRFPDFVRADLISLMITHLDGKTVPGSTHPMQCYVVPQHIHKEDLYKPGLRSGYDLDTKKWLVLPEHDRTIDVHKKYPALIAYCKMVEDKLRLMLKYDKYGAKIMWDNIHAKRARDQKAGKGDFSDSNIIYKWIANAGLFPAISDVTGEYLAKASTWQHVAAVDHQSVLDANQGQDLAGLPGKVNVPTHGPLTFHSNRDIQNISQDYVRKAGLPDEHPTEYVEVDPAKSAQVAQAYEQMPHNPHDPAVKASYDALAKETLAQYNHAVNHGYNFEFYPEGQDPYPNSPREAVLDLHHNKHMYVYPTESGYGNEGDQDTADHPLLQDSGVRWNDKPVTNNDLFRAVHDFYGHAKEGLGFRASGEDNAWRQHAAMFSPLARGAMTAETRGQNSWVNYGPHGEHNQTANQEDTVYAPQKAGLMPEWVSDPNLHKQEDWHS